MIDKEKDFLLEVAKSQAKGLKVISMDMHNLASSTRETKVEDEDKFQSNLVMGAFYMTAVSVASKAFKKMVDGIQIEPNSKNGQLYYFRQVLDEMEAENRAKADKMQEMTP